MPQDIVPDPPHATASPGGAATLARICHHALLSGACQFIPLPFVDDAADQRVRRRMIQGLLDKHNRPYDARTLEPLYAGPRRGMARQAWTTSKALVFKPIKKIFRTVLIVLTVRRAVLETAEVVLLGHTLDRLLADGRFAADAPPDALSKEAERVRRAVEHALAGPERQALLRVVRTTARRFWPPTATDVTQAAADPEQALADPDRSRLDEAAGDLKSRLKAGIDVFGPLDRLVDARLAR